MIGPRGGRVKRGSVGGAGSAPAARGSGALAIDPRAPGQQTFVVRRAFLPRATPGWALPLRGVGASLPGSSAARGHRAAVGGRGFVIRGLGGGIVSLGLDGLGGAAFVWRDEGNAILFVRSGSVGGGLVSLKLGGDVGPVLGEQPEVDGESVACSLSGLGGGG